jgi:hypothetical protein
MSTKTLGVSPGGTGAAYFVRDLDTAGETAYSETDSIRATGRVYYAPFQVRHTITVDGLIFVHGNVAGGRLYATLYDSDPTVAPQPRNRIAVSADTVASGTNRRQYVAFTAPIQLQPGIYFAALETNNANDNYTQVYDTMAQFTAGPVNGLTYFYEDLGPYAIPPAVATPLVITAVGQATRTRMRVASIP